MVPSIDEIFSLLKQDIIQQIIFDSELKNYVDIHQFTQIEINEYFLNCIEIIKSKPKLITRFVEESTVYDETKYHKENLITHLYCVGWICVLFSAKYKLDPVFAFKLGFFHDIGKPWAKKYIQKKKKLISNSKGHAQVGENICCELGLDSIISWCVSNHMCSCCHENNLSTHWEYVYSLQTISHPKSIVLGDKTKLFEYANSLACLMIGDDMGRLGDVGKNYSNIISHSELWVSWFKEQTIETHNPIKCSVKNLCSLHPDNSIIIQMYGHSGFGKSTTVKKITHKLDELGIDWKHVERDRSYYNVYAQTNNMDVDEAIDTIDYIDVYEFVQANELKAKVQLDWVNQLNQILDSDSKVKIIDTVQLMYPSDWESTINSLNPDAQSVHKSSFKIGYYGFPQSEYGREYVPKTGSYQLIPRDKSDTFTWPNINTELDKNQQFSPNLIDVGYGNIERVINSIINYNDWSKLYAPEKQVHLIDILGFVDKSKLTSKYIQEYITNQFPPGIIQSNEEYHYYNSHIIRFTYRDGMQIFHGSSRDYRGETILFDSSKLEYYIGRVSLPVFSDYSDLRKDPGIKDILTNGTCNKFNIIPKFDGSLFVLALIKSGTPEYLIVSKLLHLIDTKSYLSNEIGIWCFGSKGCMFAKDQYGDRGVLSSILNSIKASYGDVGNFISAVSNEINSNGFIDIYKNISLCFEAIDIVPNPGLTVDYGRAFCPFLCWIVWDGVKKNIIIPKNQLYLNPVASITEVDTWDKVIEFKNQAHSRLLEGSEVDEPEGYVVWFENGNGNITLGVKLKHPEYYVAHKPYTKKNMEMAKKIEFDPEYSKLKTRLLKFKPKPPVAELVGKNLDFVIDLFVDNYKYLNSKKNWAIRWKENTLLKELNQMLEIIETDIVVFYPQFKGSLKEKGFGFAMDYFDKRDGWRDYFCLKYLKI